MNTNKSIDLLPWLESRLTTYQKKEKKEEKLELDKEFDGN